MTIDGVAYHKENDIQKFSINSKLYTETAIFKTCYVFIDKYYIYLDYTDQNTIAAMIKPKRKESTNSDFVGEFFNELINQRLRLDVNRETGKIRELLVAKSLFEGTLIEEHTIEFDTESGDSYLNDPKNIGDLKGVE